MSRFVSIVLMLLAVPIGAMAIGRLSSFTHDVRDERTYFRMRVHLRHAGEPIEADLVVACGARITRYRDGGSSIDTGLYPFRYAFAIPGGHALEIRTPGVCRGETTANGGVPASFLPDVIWHERADDLSFGILYASDDAYANPRAQLAFGGAEILPSTRAEFEHWMASAPENLMPRFAAGSLRGAGIDPPGLRVTADFLGDTARYAHVFGPPYDCYAVLRLKDYGTTTMRRGDGLYRRSGGGALHSSPQELQGPLFPFRSNSGVPWLKPELVHAQTIYADVEMIPETRGFAYCFDGLLTIGSQIVRDLLGDQSFTPLGRNLVARVNGEEVENTFASGFDSSFFIFENDEYLLRQRNF